MNQVTRQYIIETYRKRAKNYDFTANLYYLIGYPEWKYRRMTIEALDLQPGDTVVEIACGTGLNFALYQDAVGPEGRIIGVDLTDAMLERARRRVIEQGWNNVELVHRDALSYTFPEPLDAVISTFALSLIPEADQILHRSVQALKPGGKLALLELQIPESWPEWMASLGIWLMSPFAATDEWRARQPWTAIRQTIHDLMTDVTVTEKYLGLTYLIAGSKR